MPLRCVEFIVPRRHVLRAVIVGEVLEAEFLQHGRTRLRPTLRPIERHDAPGNEIVLGEEIAVHI